MWGSGDAAVPPQARALAAARAQGAVRAARARGAGRGAAGPRPRTLGPWLDHGRFHVQLRRLILCVISGSYIALYIL